MIGAGAGGAAAGLIALAAILVGLLAWGLNRLSRQLGWWLLGGLAFVAAAHLLLL